MVFKRWHYGEYMCVGSVVQEKMVFKRWHYGEYMCVIILKWISGTGKDGV